MIESNKRISYFEHFFIKTRPSPIPTMKIPAIIIDGIIHCPSLEMKFSCEGNYKLISLTICWLHFVNQLLKNQFKINFV